MRDLRQYRTGLIPPVAFATAADQEEVACLADSAFTLLALVA